MRGPAAAPLAGVATAVWALSLARGVGSLSVSSRQTTSTSGRSPPFDEYVAARGRNYVPGSATWEARRGIYERAAAAVDAHNLRPGRTWTAEVGKYADYTDDERTALHGWFREDSEAAVRISLKEGGGNGTVRLAAGLEVPALPQAVSWAHLAAMQNIRDQGHCGSCWAVSALKAVEAHFEIYRGEHRAFSVQHLVSCAENKKHCGGTGGCHGATSDIAFNYILNSGILEEDAYPYHQFDEECPTQLQARMANSAASLGMEGWDRLPENQYEPLMHALVEQGPVVVSIAGSSGFGGFGIDYYSTGIYDLCKQEAILNHAMVLFGYGVDGGKGYWHLQNSWGPDWGEDGNMRMLRNQEIEKFWCGVDDQPQKGSGCPGGPPEITVCGHCGILYKGTLPRFSKSPGRVPLEPKVSGAPISPAGALVTPAAAIAKQPAPAPEEEEPRWRRRRGNRRR